MTPSSGVRPAVLRASLSGWLAALTLVAICGCERRQTDGKYFGTTKRTGKEVTTFYLNNHDEPEYLDPGLSTESAGSTLLNDLFEGLVVLHPDDLRPVQGVAARYDKSEDNRFFRFHLRSDAKWSDGKPVVAGDFVYAWRRVLTAETGARMATIMYPLKNGKLFHQGKAKATREPVTLLPEETAAAPRRGRVELPKGAALRVLKTSPAKTDFYLQAELPDDPSAPLSYEPRAEGSPPSLRHREQTYAAPRKTTGRVWINGLGPATKCNGASDHWYRVRVDEDGGWLPGCVLVDDPSASHALVEHLPRPSFRPAPTSDPPTDPEQGGAGGEGGGPTEEGSEGGEGGGTDGASPAGPEAAPPRRGLVPRVALVDDPSLIGLRAVDDHTLEVELEEPTPYFLELCGYVTYYPVRKDVIEKFEAQGRPDLWYRPENIVTNGPYLLTEHKFRYELTFERNPHYHHHDALKIHRIVWLEVPDYHATMNLYETGEIDYIGSNLSLPQAYLDRLSKYEDFNRSVWLATYWYEFNVDKEPVDDVRVRRALNLSVDKQLLIDKVARGGQQPATHVIPDATGAGYDELAETEGDPMGKGLFSGKGWDFDPELARQLLAEAGYPVKKRGDGFHAEGFPPLEILYNTSEGHRAIAVAIQDMWKRHLGISVQLRNEEWKVMLKNLRDGHFQVARFGWVADYNHPHTYLDTFLGYSNNNWTNWEDPRFDHLVEKAASTADPTESMRIYRQAEKRAMDAMPRMPLYFYTKSSLIKPYVKGYYPNAANRHKVQWMWIDPDWRTDPDNRPAYPPEELAPPGPIAAP